MGWMTISPLLPSTHGIEIDIQRAERHNACVRALTDLYCAHNYRPYPLPLIDSYENYSALLDGADIQRSFRFINSAGELVLLRPDLTLFLTRHVAHTLQVSDLPLRLCCSDNVVRERPRAEGGGQLEQYQSGVELIGSVQTDSQDDAGNRHNAGIEDELELFALLQEALVTLNLAGSVIHIGSRNIPRYALPHLDPHHASYELIIAAIRHRRADELLRLLGERGGYEASGAAALASLLLHIGDAPPAVPEIAERETAHMLRNELDRLNELVIAARARGVQNIRIDLSEIGDRTYYSGTTFAVYHPQVADKIASGGRYDGLFAAHGFDVPAAGFTFFLHRCEEYAAVKGGHGQEAAGRVDGTLRLSGAEGTRRT